MNDEARQSPPNPSSPRPNGQVSEIEKELVALWGPVLDEESLWRALRYPSKGAFRKALSRGLVPVDVVEIAGRRGRFARTRNVAIWWESQLEDSK